MNTFEERQALALSVPVPLRNEERTTGYLGTVCDYVRLNPVRARLSLPEVPPKACRWSSYPEYLKRAGERSAWPRVEGVLGELGIGRDDAEGRQGFGGAMEERRRGGQARRMEGDSPRVVFGWSPVEGAIVRNDESRDGRPSWRGTEAGDR